VGWPRAWLAAWLAAAAAHCFPPPENGHQPQLRRQRESGKLPCMPPRGHLRTVWWVAAVVGAAVIEQGSSSSGGGGSSRRHHTKPREQAEEQSSCPGEVGMAQCAWKQVKTVLPAARPHWVGNGFYVYPVFSHLAFSNDISPLLMFDYAAPKHFPASVHEQRGVGQHPHRGFETVTIAFEGAIEHADSTGVPSAGSRPAYFSPVVSACALWICGCAGTRDVINAGDVQWMTAGRGIIHEEFHATELTRRGGTVEMVQLWVNLPAKHKMTKPAYQPILGRDIPVRPLSSADPADGHVRCGAIICSIARCPGAWGVAAAHATIIGRYPAAARSSSWW
jgi:hypothetical protein